MRTASVNSRPRRRGYAGELIASLIGLAPEEEPRLLWRAVGYTGFPYRELAERLRGTVKVHGAAKVAEALRELVTHTSQRTMLRTEARKWCGQLLGPPPERWDEFYTGLDGTVLSVIIS